MYGAQAAGCNPIIDAVKRGRREIRPVKPNTIAKSLAIGNPADGYYRRGLDPKIRRLGGRCDRPGNRRRHPAAGGNGRRVHRNCRRGNHRVTQKLIQQGRIKADDLIVLAITGNGLKTLDALDLEPPQVIEPKLAAFEEVFGGVHHVA